MKNQFFGEWITVSGLITGQDLIRELTGKDLGERLLLPVNMFKSGEPLFLDDISLKEVESVLQTEIDVVKSSGWDFVDALRGIGEAGRPESKRERDSKSRCRPYEGVNG